MRCVLAPARSAMVVCMVVGSWLAPLASVHADDQPDGVQAVGSHRNGDRRESTVGMPARIEDLVLPGPELEVVPLDSHSPMVLRILAVHPHGSDFRYDLEHCGLEAGDYDLRDFLRVKDPGVATVNLPPIPVTVRSVLRADQLRPHPVADGRVPSIGGYRVLLVVGGTIWVVGLIALLLVARKRKAAAEAERPRARTLAERLRPLVEQAIAGVLSRRERAELESGLVAYWRRKLRFEERRPEEALALLHADAQAGPLLRGLEQWLHMPAPPTAIDVTALLEPYRHLPADALDLPDNAAHAPARG